MNWDKVIFDHPRINEGGVQMLAYRPYSTNPGDAFLFRTLCYWPRRYAKEWIVWHFNAEMNKHFQGYYFLDKNRAYAYYLKKCNIDVEFLENVNAIEMDEVGIEFTEDETHFDHGNDKSHDYRIFSIYGRLESGEAKHITDHKISSDAIQMGLYIANRYFLPFNNHTKEEQSNGD